MALARPTIHIRTESLHLRGPKTLAYFGLVTLFNPNAVPLRYSRTSEGGFFPNLFWERDLCRFRPD